EELLRASTVQWEDIEWLCPGGAPGERASPPPPGYAAAQEGLMARTAGRPGGGAWGARRGGGGGGPPPPPRLREPLAAYEAAVQRELVAPLQRWALEGHDPVARVAGAGPPHGDFMLHRVAP